MAKKGVRLLTCWRRPKPDDPRRRSCIKMPMVPTRERNTKRPMSFLVLRSLVGTMAFYDNFCAVDHLVLADAHSARSSPFFVFFPIFCSRKRSHQFRRIKCRALQIYNKPCLDFAKVLTGVHSSCWLGGDISQDPPTPACGDTCRGPLSWCFSPRLCLRPLPNLYF